MDNELIVVRQLPIIEDQLQTVHDNILARVSEVLAMECTEETYKEVKKARSELNAQYRVLEQRRKEVKAQIEAPYKKLEAIYKACAGDLFVKADKQLAEKIASVEMGLKQKKADEIRSYFNEYRESQGIPDELVTYEKAGINVTLSASVKSLKAQAKAFLDRISDDLTLIETQEHGEEVYVEYCKSLNVSQAVTTVANRHAAIERQRKLREETQTTIEQKKAVEAAVQRVVEETVPAEPENPPILMPPIAEKVEESEEPMKQYSTAFRVTGSLEQLKALKKFLVDGGYMYEQLN